MEDALDKYTKVIIPTKTQHKRQVRSWTAYWATNYHLQPSDHPNKNIKHMMDRENNWEQPKHFAYNKCALIPQLSQMDIFKSQEKE